MVETWKIFFPVFYVQVSDFFGIHSYPFNFSCLRIKIPLNRGLVVLVIIQIEAARIVQTDLFGVVVQRHIILLVWKLFERNIWCNCLLLNDIAKCLSTIFCIRVWSFAWKRHVQERKWIKFLSKYFHFSVYYDRKYYKHTTSSPQVGPVYMLVNTTSWFGVATWKNIRIYCLELHRHFIW